MKLLSLVKTTAFLLWFTAGMVLVAVGTSMWAVQATFTATRLATEVASTAVRHRKELSATVMRVKAKARLKRMVTMIPLAGLAAGAYFEEQEYQEWLADNPGGSRSEYLCELAAVSSDVIDEVLVGLPAAVQQAPDMLNSMMPTCETN